VKKIQRKSKEGKGLLESASPYKKKKGNISSDAKTPPGSLWRRGRLSKQEIILWKEKKRVFPKSTQIMNETLEKKDPKVGK